MAGSLAGESKPLVNGDVLHDQPEREAGSDGGILVDPSLLDRIGFIDYGP